MQITNVVIAGAPCSGKTTVINKIYDYYKRNGLNVYLCPESATVVLENGFDRRDVPAFELEIARVQQEAEAKILDDIYSKGLEKALVLHDRGLTDCYSYVEDRDSFEEKVGIDVCTTWSRYDAVIMLETTAVNGMIENSEVRIESVNEALADQKNLLDVYIGHPHFRYIKVCDSVDDKLNKAIAEIDMLLNNIELEKKYLIEYPNINDLEKYNPFLSEISQTYLLSSLGSHRIRERITNGVSTYFETLKIRIAGDRAEEYESIISRQDYDELMKNADPNKNTIVKKRYCFLYDGQYFELDLFPFWSDKAFLELELSSEDESINLPPEIKLIKDVSNDSKYKNNYLASLKL